MSRRTASKRRKVRRREALEELAARTVRKDNNHQCQHGPRVRMEKGSWVAMCCPSGACEARYVRTPKTVHRDDGTGMSACTCGEPFCFEFEKGE